MKNDFFESENHENTLNEIIEKIYLRKKDAEIRTCKDGIKIFEVSKKLIAVLPHTNEKTAIFKN